MVYDQPEGETKVVWRKVPSWKRTKIAWDLFHPEDKKKKKKIKNAPQKLETSVAPDMPCKIVKKIVGVVDPANWNKTCVYSGTWWIYETAYAKFSTKLSSRPYCRKKQFITTLIKFTNSFLCLKLRNFLLQKQRWTRNGKNCGKFRRGTWQKSRDRNDRWKQRHRTQKFILHH